MIEIISGTWAAGETKDFVIQGDRLEILDAQYPCDVYLMNESGAQLSVMRNSEASFFSGPKGGFKHVQIKSVQAQVIRFFIGSGDAGTRRISSTVQVVDGGKLRTIAQTVFLGYGFQGLVASQVAVIQLWNPPGSGKRLVVSQVQASNFDASPQVAHVSYDTVAIGSLTTNQPRNKLLGGAASVAQTRAVNTASAPVTGMCDLYMPAKQGVFFKFTEPVVVNPGFGLQLDGSLSVPLSGQFEYYEESIV